MDKEDLDNSISQAIMNNDAMSLREVFVSSKLDPDELGAWLSLASAEGKHAAMKELIATGANVNRASEEGETPLSYACANNQWTSAKLLVEHGADVNSPLTDGLTPLEVAVCHSSPEFRSWLRSVGGIRTGDWEEWPWPPSPKPK